MSMPTLEITAHVHSQGDVSGKGYQQFVGTKGMSKKLEGFSITTPGPGVDIKYMAHIDGADTKWVHSGHFLGFRGQARVEGFAVTLKGPSADVYDVKYYAHISGSGDSPVSANGDFVGTKGQGRSIEGLAVWLEPKHSRSPFPPGVVAPAMGFPPNPAYPSPLPPPSSNYPPSNYPPYGQNPPAAYPPSSYPPPPNTNSNYPPPSLTKNYPPSSYPPPPNANYPPGYPPSSYPQPGGAYPPSAPPPGAYPPSPSPLYPSLPPGAYPPPTAGYPSAPRAGAYPSPPIPSPSPYPPQAYGGPVYSGPPPELKYTIGYAGNGVAQKNSHVFVGHKDCRMEFLQISSAVPGFDIEYMACIQNRGDTRWHRNGEQIGHHNGGIIEGFAVRLVGPAAASYVVRYSGQIQHEGTNNGCDGEYVGTRGQGKALEGIVVWVERRC